MALALAEIRRILRGPNPLAAIRSAAYPEPKPEAERPQLALWIVDAEGLPPRPWLICGDSRFDCHTLGCKGMLARVCVARQAASDAQRTRDTWRGQGFDHPSCVTEKCAQGRAIRAVLDPTRHLRWRGAGPNARFGKGRADAVEQYEARCRLDAVGLLDEVPTVDAEPVTVESEGDGEDWSHASNRQAEREPESAAAARGTPVEAGAEREPERAPQGVRGVREAMPRGGRPGRVPDAHGRDGGRDVRAGQGEGGRDGARLRLGKAEAGARSERAERRAGAVADAPGNAARRDDR